MGFVVKFAVEFSHPRSATPTQPQLGKLQGGGGDKKNTEMGGAVPLCGHACRHSIKRPCWIIPKAKPAHTITRRMNEWMNEWTLFQTHGPPPVKPKRKTPPPSSHTHIHHSPQHTWWKMWSYAWNTTDTCHKLWWCLFGNFWQSKNWLEYSESHWGNVFSCSRLAN